MAQRHSAACCVVENKRSCLAGPVISGSASVHRQCPCLISQIMNEKEADVMIMCRTTSELWSEKAFGSISRSAIAATKAGGRVQGAETHFLFHENLVIFRGNDEGPALSVSRK